MLYVSQFFTCVWISHPKLLLAIFAKSSPTAVQAWWMALCQARSWVGSPTFLSCPFATHRTQCLSVMKAKIQFIDFRSCHFELTCWSTYSNHKSSLCTLFIGHIPYWGIACIPAQNEHLLIHQFSQSHQQILVSYFIMISSGNLWTLQAALTIWSGFPS